jgi:gliding motility-associated-like protein
LTITVNPKAVPLFSAVAAICEGETISPLPTTSVNGITGTWSPAINNTVTTEYTFTPSSGECAAEAKLTITVNPKAVPLFTQIGPLYQNSATPVLPLRSINGISGTWNPANIITTTVGKTTYTFTPLSDMCAWPFQIDITVIPLKAIAGNDTVIGVCGGAILNASKSFGVGLTYQWRSLDVGGVLSDQDKAISHFTLSPSYKGPLPGVFSVELVITDNKGNSDRDTVVVSIDTPPIADIFHSDKLEKDGSMEVDGTISVGMGLSYNWYTKEGQVIGSNNEPKALIKGPGIYYLEVTDRFGCKSLKEFMFPFEDHILIGYPDYARTSWVDAIDIPVLDNDYDSRNDINTSTLHIVKEPTMGSVKVNPDGTVTYIPLVHKAGRDQFIYEICDALNICDTVMVAVDLIDGPIWIPEAISPNSDGSNEKFVIRGLDVYPNSAITIYTRSGQLIYKNPDYRNDWDGLAMGSRIEDGTLLPTGTYYYVLHLGGTNRYLKGFVYVAY